MLDQAVVIKGVDVDRCQRQIASNRVGFDFGVPPDEVLLPGFVVVRLACSFDTFSNGGVVEVWHFGRAELRADATDTVIAKAVDRAASHNGEDSVACESSVHRCPRECETEFLLELAHRSWIVLIVERPAANARWLELEISV